MAPREAYIRAVFKSGTYETVIGLEWRDGDPLHRIRYELRELAAKVRRSAPGSEMDHATEVADAIVIAFPERAYFVELAFEAPEGWVQIFQPYGVPRVR